MTNHKINTYTVLFLVTVALALFNVGCIKKETNSSSTDHPQQGEGSVAEGPKDKGASSGGGGYVTKNSKKILELVVGDLAQEIRHASPFLFNDLPDGWTQEKFANVLSDIRMNSTKDIQRDNSDLLFNYGTDEKGPYIEALRPFFTVYGHIPVTFLEMYSKENSEKNSEYENFKNNFKATLLDLKLKVLHEVSHHFGKDEKQAEIYSLDLLRKLERDFYICMVPRKDVTNAPNVLWVSPTGKRTDVPCDQATDTECGLNSLSDFVIANGWIYHQAKESLFSSFFTGSLNSHLDPQSFEGLKEHLSKDKSVPGVLWEKYFSERQTLSRLSNSDKSVSEFTEPVLDDEAGIESVVSNQPPQGIQELPTFSSEPLLKLIPTKVKIEFQSSRVFKSGSVSVPAVDFTPRQVEGKSTHGNPKAKIGEPNGKSVELPLNCEYVGVSN